ncbi:MAG TPA: hypothetical protein VG323_09850 [Thermoanaerobaculia bacterium]|nr:hypothetical protein [Thermoanaerobaculia bacterium]
MLRRLPLLILAVALLLAIEPVVHSHPLWENSDARTAASNGACAVCAAGVTQLPSAPPAVVAPVLVVSVIAAETASQPSASLVLPRASRAPPAA